VAISAAAGLGAAVHVLGRGQWAVQMVAAHAAKIAGVGKGSLHADAACLMTIFLQSRWRPLIVSTLHGDYTALVAPKHDQWLKNIHARVAAFAGFMQVCRHQRPLISADTFERPI